MPPRVGKPKSKKKMMDDSPMMKKKKKKGPMKSGYSSNSY